MRQFFRALLFLLAASTTQAALGQVIVPAPNQKEPAPAPLKAPPPTPAPTKAIPYGAGMKINISADGSKYVRFVSTTQIWTRYTENNSGTTDAPSKPQAKQIDFGLRRMRLLIVAQLNPRFLLFTQLGLNSQNEVAGGAPNDPTGPGKKPQLYVHEAVTEYRVNQYLSLGAGIHYYNGISRMSSFSSISMMTIDVPGTNSPTIDAIDQTSRWMGAYAKGRFGGFDYRVSVNNSFLNNIASTPDLLTTNVAQYNPRNTGKVYQGYFYYHFLAKEANLLPYTVGTYLGTKKVFNLGAGFLYDADGMYVRPSANPTTLPTNRFDIPTDTKDLSVYAADIFYDTPLDTIRKTSLTFYGVYYKYNMGPNYVRYVGALNPGYGSTGNAALRGNAIPVVDTGSALYAQAGYLLPIKVLGPKVRVQPYGAYLHGVYEGLRTSDGNIRDVNVYDAGINFYLDAHQAKFTLNYRDRPDFTDVNNVVYRPEVTLQTQISL